MPDGIVGTTHVQEAAVQRPPPQSRSPDARPQPHWAVRHPAAGTEPGLAQRDHSVTLAEVVKSLFYNTFINFTYAGCEGDGTIVTDLLPGFSCLGMGGQHLREGVRLCLVSLKHSVPRPKVEIGGTVLLLNLLNLFINVAA